MSRQGREKECVESVQVISAGYLVVFQADDRRTSHTFPSFFLFCPCVANPVVTTWCCQERINRTEAVVACLPTVIPTCACCTSDRGPDNAFGTCAEGRLQLQVHLTTPFVASPDISSLQVQRQVDRPPRSSGRWITLMILVIHQS